MDLTRLGENICRLRTEKRLSQEELAAALAVSRQSVSKWETGASVPDLDKLMRLSEIFGVTLDALVRGPVPPEQSETEAAAAPRPGGPAPAAAGLPFAGRPLEGSTAEGLSSAAGAAGCTGPADAAPLPNAGTAAASRKGAAGSPAAAASSDARTAASFASGQAGFAGAASGMPAQAAGGREADPSAFAQGRSAAPVRPLAQTIVGGLLVGFSALVWLLCTLLGGVLAGLIYALPFLLCGIICLKARRHAGLWCAWAVGFCLDVYLRWTTGLNWRMIRYTFLWEDSWNYVRLAIAWVQAAGLAALLLVTVWRLGRRPLALTRPQQVRLAAGWLGFVLLAAIVFLMQYGIGILLQGPDLLAAWPMLYSLLYYIGDWLLLPALTAMLTVTVRALRGRRARKN